MFSVSARTMEAVAQGASLRVAASGWYAGEIVVPSLELGTGGSLERSIGQYGTTARLRLPVLDPDGSLSRLALGSPLMPFGQRLSVSVEVARETIPLGVFRITDPGHEAPLWARRVGSTLIPSAAQLTVEADDLLGELADEDLVVPFAPLAGGTVASEARRVVDGILPIGGWPDTAGRSVPAGSTWDSSRLVALSGILGVADLWPDMDRTGGIRPLAQTARTAVDWVLPEDVVAGGVRPTIDASAIINGVVVRGETASGEPLTGTAFIDAGPLRWGGPLGRRPLVEHNPLMQTASAITAAAATRLAGLESRRAVTVSVRAPANPALDLMDVLQLPLAEKTLTGTVSAYTLPLSGGLMDITVSVPWRQVWS